MSWDVGSGWVGTRAWKTGMCEMRIFGSKICSVSWDVGSGWVGSHAWKTGMCEMKIFGSEICSVSWDVGSGWVGSHACCNMESCSGKVQKRDV